MKAKFFLAAMMAATMAACTNNASEFETSDMPEPTEVTLTFSPYDVTPMTRTATSIASIVNHLDVWLYESGSEVAAVHQTSSNTGFGTITATLDKTKTYTLYAVAHKADGATLSDGIIAFTDDKVTHTMFYTTTFTPATTTSLSCLMTRIVALFRLSITDDVPADCKKLQFTITDVYDRWSVTDGGTHQLDRTSTVTYGGTSANFSVYAITTDAQTLHTVTVTALDADDNELQTRTFENVPLRNGYRTQYTGTFFIDTPTSAAFTVENDWNEYDEVTF